MIKRGKASFWRLAGFGLAGEEDAGSGDELASRSRRAQPSASGRASFKLKPGEKSTLKGSGKTIRCGFGVFITSWESEFHLAVVSFSPPPPEILGNLNAERDATVLTR